MNKRFLRFRHAAIRRYGDKAWIAADGYIEINPTYTVSAGICEKSIVGAEGDYPYIIELSNGTKFLTFLYKYGKSQDEEVLTEEGEKANRNSSNYSYTLTGNVRTLNK